MASIAKKGQKKDKKEKKDKHGGGGKEKKLVLTPAAIAINVKWADDSVAAVATDALTTNHHIATRALPHEGKWLRCIICLPRHIEPDHNSVVVVMTFPAECPSHAPPVLDVVDVPATRGGVTTATLIRKQWSDAWNGINSTTPATSLLTWIQAIEAAIPSLSPTSAAIEVKDVASTVTTIHTGPYVRQADSEFIARLGVVKTVSDARGFLTNIKAMDRRASWATHNIWLYRIKDDRNGSGSSTSYLTATDEDGEYGSGRRLELLLECYDVTDAVIVVTRWFGGVLLGTARFAYIIGVAQRLLEAQGYTMTPANAARWAAEGTPLLPPRST